MSKNDINAFYNSDETSASSEYVDNSKYNYSVGDKHNKKEVYLHEIRPYVLGKIYIWKEKQYVENKQSRRR